MHRGSTDSRESSPLGVAWQLAVVDAHQVLGCLDREADCAEALVDLLLVIVEGKGAERFSGPIMPGVGIDRHKPIGSDPLRSADAAQSVRRVPGIAAAAAHHDAPIPP